MLPILYAYAQESKTETGNLYPCLSFMSQKNSLAEDSTSEFLSLGQMIIHHHKGFDHLQRFHCCFGSQREATDIPNVGRCRGYSLGEIAIR